LAASASSRFPRKRHFSHSSEAVMKRMTASGSGADL
jgi:hypothetical protein